MNKLHFMIIRSTALVFFITLLFFVLLLEMIDVFGSLWQYIDKQVPFTDIFAIALNYLPKCISFALPVALLFSVSFTLGTLYANNELIGILGSGMSFFSLIMPLLVIGFLLSGAVFLFEETAVIPATKQKMELQAMALKALSAGPEARDIGFIDRENDTFIKADAFLSRENSLVGLEVFDRSRHRLIYADRAQWTDDAWILPVCFIYERNADETHLQARRVNQYRAEEISQTPETFKLTTDKIEEMDIGSAAEWIGELESSGLPVQIARTGFFNKFSYALRVFIVCILAASIGGAFRKNILLMCLLASLVISVVFFVFQLITDAFAKNGFLPPAVGAFLPVGLFFIVGVVLLARART